MKAMQDDTDKQGGQYSVYEKVLLALPIVLEALNFVALPLAVSTKGQIVLGMYTSICTPVLDMAIMVRYLMVYTLSVLRNDGAASAAKQQGGPKSKAHAPVTEAVTTHEYEKPSLSQFAQVSRLE